MTIQYKKRGLTNLLTLTFKENVQETRQEKHEETN
jgi:hypothetical protein